jgi:hypothetical protein
METSRTEKSFGRFERAMNTRGVRQYIEAKSPTDLEPDSREAFDAEPAQMKQLLGFLYGEPGGPEALFSDTRRIDELAAALESDEGRKILEEDRDLDRAFDAAGGRKDLVLKSLARGLTALQQALPYVGDFGGDEEIAQSLAAVSLELHALSDAFEGAAQAVEAGEDYDLGEDDDEDDDEQGAGQA